MPLADDIRALRDATWELVAKLVADLADAAAVKAA